MNGHDYRALEVRECVKITTSGFYFDSLAILMK